MLYFGIYRLEFQNAVVIFEIMTLESFVSMQIFIWKQEYFNLGQKLLYLGIFGLKIWERSHCHTWDYCSGISLIANFDLGIIWL